MRGLTENDQFRTPRVGRNRSLRSFRPPMGIGTRHRSASCCLQWRPRKVLTLLAEHGPPRDERHVQITDQSLDLFVGAEPDVSQLDVIVRAVGFEPLLMWRFGEDFADPLEMAVVAQALFDC